MTDDQATASRRAAANHRVPLDEKLVLCLDGSTPVSSAALLRSCSRPAAEVSTFGAWEVIERRAVVDTHGHARVLLQLTDDILVALGLTPRSLGAVVVGIGPGTFTGVRVAVAAARAMALALTIPVVGVSTLSALAAGAALRLETDQAPPKQLTAAVDARRGQLFCVSYERKERGWVQVSDIVVCDRGEIGMSVREPAAVVCPDQDLVGPLPEGVTFIPTSVEAEHLVVGQELLQEQECNQPGVAAESAKCLCGAELGPWLIGLMAEGAYGRIAPGELGTPESVKPIYVRSPDADVHITKRRDPWTSMECSRTSRDRPA